MTVYYFSLALTITLSILLSRKNTVINCDLENHRQSFIYYDFHSFARVVIVLLPLIFVLCFRWNVGIDSAYGGSYSRVYHYAAKGSNPDGMEIGFYLLCRLFSANSTPWFWFLFFLAISSMLFYAYGLYKSEVDPVLFVLSFFFLNTYFDCFSSLRQSLVQGICVANMGWWINREPLDDRKDELKAEMKYVLIFCIASLFHRIALLFVMLHFVCRKKYNVKNCVIACVTGLVLSPLIRAVSRYMINMFTGEKYALSASSFGSSYAIIALVVFCLALYQFSAMQEVTHNAYYLVNYAMCTFILMINSGALVLPFRFFDMLKISYLYTIPIVIKSGKTQLRRIVYFIIFAVLIGVWFWNSIYNQDSIFRHYQSAFDDWNYIVELP